MSDEALLIPVQEIAEICGVSHGKILLALRRRDLHESAVSGNGREASITSRSACRTILRDLLETEEYEDAADTLMGNAPGPSDDGQGSGGHHGESDLLTPKKISLVGRGREKDYAIAQADRGYAFLESDDLDEDCHLWISDLSERAKNYLDVSEETAGHLPAVVPQVQFRPQDSPEGTTVETVVDAAPRWSSALISVQDDGEAEIPNHSGPIRLWTDEDLDPGPYIARVWPAIPTDVEGTATDAVIATPEERFSWDESPVDNLDAIEEDLEPVESLLEGTADRIVSYIDGEEDEAFELSVLAGIFEMLSGRGEVLGRRVHQIVVDRLQERTSTVSPEAVQGLVEAAPEENEEELDKCAQMLVEGIASRLEEGLQATSLDLETDGHEIWEIGMAATRDGAQTYERSSIRDGLQAVRSSETKAWIGHNFRNWDRDVLAENDVRIPDEDVWDTLEVEALLSPHRESLALETSHKAGEDAQVAHRLFCTQVIRGLLRLHRGIPCSATELLGPIAEAQTVEHIRAVLSEVEAIHDRVRSLCEIRRDGLLSSSAQPEVVRWIRTHLEDLPAGETVHLLYPRPLESLMERLPEVRFAGRVDGPYQQQVRSPSDVGDGRDPFLRRFATLYRHDCSARNRDPVVGRLSPWIQSRLRQNPKWIGPREESSSNGSNGEGRGEAHAIPAEKYREAGLEAPDQIIAVAPDLIEAYSSNVVSEYAPDELTDFVSRNHLWAQFDGAGSYCELTDDHVTELGFDGIAARSESKGWLQRTPQGKYVLHEHQPRVLSTTRSALPDSCEWREVRLDEEDGGPVSCVAVDEQANTSPLQQRLNPNTPQRAWYWTVQGLLLREVAEEEDRPIVLLTREQRKVDALTSFFQQRGWHVPAEGTLRRRLERLEASRESQRLVVVPLQRWTKLITQEVSPEVQLVVESLPIKEQQAMRGDEVHPEDLQNLPGQAESGAREDETHRPEADSEEEDTIETPEGDSPQNRPFAIQRGLYLIAPLLKWLSHTASTLSGDGRLWVLDPRVEPIDLPQEVELEAHRAAYSDSAFKSCLEEAEQHFASPVQQGDLTLPDDWKETLEHVFLPEKEDGSRGEFYDDQEVYLDPIMRRDSDVLVELPTGSGKSVLFQAPGLYHGIRHGLLTIVVTPLKALMVDQAYSLYEKGFLSSVDYVNGDLPYIEIQDIYRRLASGGISLVYVAPERFRSRSFVRAVRSRLRADGTLCYFVFDEAHTVSLWGLDFRPDFLRAVEFVNEQRDDPDIGSFPCIMLSATITEQIHEHLNNVLHDYKAQSSR
jgi:hypothetical protein